MCGCSRCLAVSFLSFPSCAACPATPHAGAFGKALVGVQAQRTATRLIGALL
jgi:hypothetical protein